MGPKIQVLPDLLIDQIAAGEVVERPASVVKELVENALDAGASHISVEIEGGGKTKIRVLDNGCGMSAASVELALLRHATSKLRSVEDLFGLQTFGFRGEALPSISAVSKMTITTRQRESDAKHPGGPLAAHRVIIEGGKIKSRSEVGAPVGTCIEVCELLYNVPARQKFLKGEATETSHITETMNKIALANPGVHIRLKNRSRTTLNAPGHDNHIDRVRAVMGSRLGKQMQRATGNYGGVEVEVYLAPPDLAQSTTRALQLFVGKRPIRDRGILSAVMQGYASLGERGIPSGRYPAAVVLIETPGSDVDVNVHPQKLEVRFSDPQLVYAAVRQTVRSGVEEAVWGRAVETDEEGPMRSITSKAPPRMDVYATKKSYSSHGTGVPASQLAVNYAREHAKSMLPWGRSKRPESDAEASVNPRAKAAARDTRKPKPASALSSTPALPNTEAGMANEENLFFSSMRYMGQLDKTYLLCEADGELVMLDQHAAHERVELEKLLKQYRERKIEVQRLLFAQRVELSQEQATAADAHGDQLAGMGFELDDFGDTEGAMSYALKAVPAGLHNAEPAEVLIKLLDNLVETGSGRAVDAKIEAMLAMVACHSVVRAGDSLGPREVQSLLQAMDHVDFRGAAPHGRPVLLRIGIDEIARRFGRS